MNMRIFLIATTSLFMFFTSSLSSADSCEDYIEIQQLLQRWAINRDQGRWDQLADTFHPDGRISVTWYSGDFSRFVAASEQMAKGSAKSKHLIGAPVIRIDGNKALSEASITIMARADVGPVQVDVTSFARFYDRLEKRDGVWRLLERTTIYEKDSMDAVEPSILFSLGTWFMNFGQYPEACRYLAYGLVRNGHELASGIVVDKSPEADSLYTAGETWFSQNQVAGSIRVLLSVYG